MNPQKLTAEPATLATPVAQIQINAHGAFVAACSPSLCIGTHRLYSAATVAALEAEIARLRGAR